jgi:hypothetical protein
MLRVVLLSARIGFRKDRADVGFAAQRAISGADDRAHRVVTINAGRRAANNGLARRGELSVARTPARAAGRQPLHRGLGDVDAGLPQLAPNAWRSRQRPSCPGCRGAPQRGMRLDKWRLFRENWVFGMHRHRSFHSPGRFPERGLTIAVVSLASRETSTLVKALINDG